ncbi:DEAD/DEAH box helicase [Paenibacillus piri]|uniref:DEAD/DEAH box helicase n=1 Tax=Paenibacillus piri TaxID=2547395 RepID=A0A4V2ZSK0_9BACL|nr:helicase-related protein [Paenibacillus piri]TDF93514.1 DEAD/DEAH box helicase [Paenibacillus piri]
MKVTLYSVRGDRMNMWHISLDINADLSYWFGQHHDSVRIWMLQPAISYGQAVALMEELNEAARGGGKKTETASSPELWLDRINRHLSAAGIGASSAEGGLSRHLVECDLKQWEAYQASLADRLLRIDAAELAAFVDAMQGRSLLMDEVMQLIEHRGLTEAASQPLAYVQMGCLTGAFRLNQGVRAVKQRRRFALLSPKMSYQCHRCGGTDEHLAYAECMFCCVPCPYCEQCLTMGRSRYCSIVVSASSHETTSYQKPEPFGQHAAEATAFEPYLQPWGLSEIQAEASLEALKFLKGNELQPAVKSAPELESRKFLIWAVTGAGKTEMIFPLIQYTVAHGGRVVVATPRRDVVLELKPRLEKAFAPEPVVTLYGGSEQRWDSGSITIATTHQLLRLHHAFDLVIIDELDAFPYHNNPMLQIAAQNVCKPGGATVLLSATPPKHLQKAVQRRQLPHVKVAARYHRQPLPVPVLMSIPPLVQQLQQHSIPVKLKHSMMASLQRGAQVFVFVPKINMVEPLTRLLSELFPGIQVEGTSSKDGSRTEKVIDFRSKQVRMLVTTTILERGVTIPKSDVFILDADAPIFDSAALVQMAGRAGRSIDDPAGSVYFAAKEKTRAQAEAVRQIKSMNALARKKGYLREKEVTKS